jgi:hypothetical protein
MLQAPTAMARARRSDELVVGQARRTTATITQPGITALERHFENLKVLAFVLAHSSGRTLGAGVKRATPLPPSDVGERCIGIMGNMYRCPSEVPIRWGPRRPDLSGNPAQRYLRLLVNVGKKCRGRGPPFGALSQEGNAGLVRAVEAIEAASTSVALEGALHGLTQPEHTVIVLRHGIGGRQAKSSRTSPRSSA